MKLVLASNNAKKLKELDAIHHFYLQTFREYGNAPALTREFISHIAREMSRNIMIVIAYNAGQAVAGAGRGR